MVTDFAQHRFRMNSEADSPTCDDEPPHPAVEDVTKETELVLEPEVLFLPIISLLRALSTGKP